MYTSKDAAQEHTEWLEELTRITHEELLTKYLDLSRRYNDLAARHNRTTGWVYALAVIVAMFAAVYWLGIPFSNSD